MEFLKKYISLVIIYLFNCLPIKKNKVFLFSYYGSQYGCSPKYITEYILKTYPKDYFDLVWAFNDPDSKVDIEGIRKVKTMSLRYFYELCTSKVLITNFRTTDLFIKRKEQYYIQTWHSSLRLKQIEKDAEGNLPASYVQIAKKDSKKCDLLLSGCDYSTEIFKRAFWYGGEIFKYGTPRNDILVHANNDMRSSILFKLNIPSSCKVAFYAPTFRKDKNLDVYNLDFSKVKETLAKRFGGEWIILVKLHPHLMSVSNQITANDLVMDVTQYDDIQELLSITDFLISDYSSLVFDYSVTKKPCFLYVPDLEDYTQNERGLYFDLRELPFTSVLNNEELMRKIQSYDETVYRKELESFLSKIGSYEDGYAAKNLATRLEEICFGKERRVMNEAV
ncbi:CDP-glycerol glycerophosphotransferase family protein [Mesobacillus subterraneus]|uniref:CDP-glycerol glycerophosphotransferase family protein n=1 Tax=Mesobacillus subterraneus TaxID=285983 RepID=UPI00203B7269|nr:CDP-glycerol glycerophosphotransferase family protein [Mesobacillus subterraneus]MCM3665238.1 CDP-glycerol glycerophosphotransferase family protein [Mesobacillus subterraneus]MCM3684251.1 CDP-glycerol glycerophosphotransferase family protein [Mesobacillus subterraneus]